MPYALAPVLQISTRTVFLPHRSTPEEKNYAWAEESQVSNCGLVTVQLRMRCCRLIREDGFCISTQDRTYGDMGPVLHPGDSVSISQNFWAETPSGIVVYSYGVATERGEEFTVETPAYSFDSPFPRAVH
jgi:ApaG protein